MRNDPVLLFNAFVALEKQQKRERQVLIDEANSIAFDENVAIDEHEEELRVLKGLGKWQKQPSASLEEIKSRFAPFLTETFTQWYDKETAEKVEQKLSLIKPEDIDWEDLKDDIDESKYGEYSLNPETQGLDFASFPHEKIKVFDFEEFIGKPRAELAKHLALNSSGKYYILGIEYWKYIIENPDKAPVVLKDGNYNYPFGSTLRDRDGGAGVPNTRWGGGRFERRARRLYDCWGSRDRVVLLEK